MTDVNTEPFRPGFDSADIRFEFPESIGEITHACLFCRYEPVN